MIISSKHHDLFEQYKIAVEIHNSAVKALHDYIITPNHDLDVVKSLSDRMEVTLNEASKLRHKLEQVSINPQKPID